MYKIGVLALQGSVIEHINCVKNAGAKPVPIKTASQLEDIDGLILPGGESTTLGILLGEFGLMLPIKEKIQNGMPVWGTCAGLILLAKNIVGQNKKYLDVMDITVKRNGFGSQLESFVSEQKIEQVSKDCMPLVFIRAPYIVSAEKNVDIMAIVRDKIVAARQNNMLATAFHPELTIHCGFYDYFIKMIEEAKETNDKQRGV